MLERAKKFNQQSLDSLNSLTEIDEKINFKQRALEERNLYQSLYNNEFETVVKILERRQFDKLQKFVVKILDRESEIKNAQQKTRLADIEFSEKYNLNN